MASVGEADRRPVMLFHRQFNEVRGMTRISGGHLKVWHYFEHVETSTQFRPLLKTADRPLAADNPWSAVPDAVVGRFARVRPAAYFLAGTDWEQLPRRRRANPGRPVVNLIQHVRHGNESDRRRPFLHYPAVRICVGPEVAASITATGAVRGPVLTIPNGTDVAVDLSRRAADRDIDIIVVGNKRPQVTRDIAARLARPGRRIHAVDGYVLRPEFLDVLSRARLAVFIPRHDEGFYLPALEAMALGTLVVCPDSVGNRSFCIDGETCWLPPYDFDAIVARTEEALLVDDTVTDRMRRRAADVVRDHDMAGERRAFLDVLAHLPELWAEAVASSPGPAGAGD
ncbi:MAG: glycosyltransferase [Acidimicrobiales bacterium]